MHSVSQAAFAPPAAGEILGTAKLAAAL